MNEHLRRAPAPDLLPRFAAIVGDKYAVTDAQALAPHLIEGRGLYQGVTSLMLRPGSTEEVAAILKLANETKTPVVPQGGNTGLVGGQIPFDGELILSLTRLDKIREVDASSNTITVEAGVVLQKAQDAAAAAGRLFPLSLGSEGSCTIGGNLSTNAGGTGALAYGIARELVAGVEVVLADGRVMHLLRKLKKDNTGYDLRHIFVGAEGTLGIITAAVLKLFPQPRAVETAFIGLKSPDAAVKLLNLAQARIGGTVTGFELMVRGIVEMALKHGHGNRDPLAGAHPWYVLMEVSSQQSEGLRDALETFLGEAIEQDLVEDATIAASLDQRKAFWHLRHTLDRSAEAGRRLDQARRLGAGRRGAGLHRRGQRIYWGAPMSSLNQGLKLLAKRLEVALFRRDRPDLFLFESEAMRDLAVKGRGLPRSATDVFRRASTKNDFTRGRRAMSARSDSTFPRATRSSSTWAICMNAKVCTC